MTELFDSITFEAYLSGVWTDITSDVCIDPSPKWNMGIMGNSTLDRVGDPEELTFALKNGQSNSAGLLGYYTPTNQNCRTGWGVGVPIRLSFSYAGEITPHYKYYGLIAPDGITTEAGIYAGRKVFIKCEGFMSLAARHVLELMTLQTNQTIVQAVPYILANMPIQPLATEYGTASDTFPTVFDTITANTVAISELQKLAMSEFGMIYTKGDKTGGQTLVVEGRGERTNTTNSTIPASISESDYLMTEDLDFLMTEDGDFLMTDESTTADFNDEAISVRTEYGATLANRIYGTSYPRQIDAAATTVLFKTQRRIQVLAGETKTDIRGRYRDPAGAATYVNGKEMVTPVSGTDFTATANEDGTGANLVANCVITATYGVEQVDYTIQNTGGSTMWVYLQARGKGIYLYDPISVLFEDATSVSAYGLFPLTLDMPYQDSPLAVESVGNLVLSNEKNPRITVNAYTILANRNSKGMYAFLYLEPGTRSYFAETMTGFGGNYFINGYSAEIVAGKYVYWTPVLKIADDTAYWRLDEGALDSTTILDT